MKVKPLSHAQLLVTPGTAAHQAPLSMGFSRQEYWSGLPLPSPQLDIEEVVSPGKEDPSRGLYISENHKLGLLEANLKMRIHL